MELSPKEFCGCNTNLFLHLDSAFLAVVPFFVGKLGTFTRRKCVVYEDGCSQ